MKKLVSLTLALLIALFVLLPAMAESTPTIRSGVLSMLNLNEEEMLNFRKARNLIGRQLEQEGYVTRKYQQILDEAGIDENLTNANIEIVYFDTLDAALMALNAGTIDEVSIYENVARYLAHSDPNLVQVIEFNGEANNSAFARIARRGLMSNSFAFMFMEKNAALRDEFDAALASLTEEEMDKLVQDQITAAISGNEISPIQMPVFDGAETIKVAVTGELPPMDYVAADGTPAGFNTALLAEISQRMGKNIELVVVDSIGRAAALASGNVDAVFWTRTNRVSNRFSENSEKALDEMQEVLKDMSEEELETLKKVDELIDIADYGHADMPEGTIVTKPYFSDVIVTVTTQSRLDQVLARTNQ